MKVAEVTSIFPPYSGGIGTVAFQHAKRLYEKNVNIKVFTVLFSQEQDFDFAIEYLKPWFKWGKAGFVPQILFKLNKYDVVKLHFPAFGMAEIVWFWKKIFGRKKKLIIFYHHDVIGKGLLGKFFKFYTKFITPVILKSADKIICSSLDYVKYGNISDFYQKHKDKFIALPFGVDEKFKPGDKKIARKKCNLPQNKKIILFCGGLDRNHYFKGVNILLRAVAKLKINNWYLVLVGGGELISTYKQQTKKLNIEKKVRFVGWQSDEILPYYYRSADVFVLPSIDKSEAFGMVLIEAMACGIPVIASNLPGVRSVVKQGKIGKLTKAGDCNDLQEKIDKVLNNEKLLFDYSQQAINNVFDNYQWNKIINKLINIYKN